MIFENKEWIYRSLYECVKMHAQTDGEKDYLITEEETISYAEALNAVENLGTQLLSWGVKKGDFVGLRVTNSADTSLIMTALGSIGAVAVCCDAHFGVEEYINNSGVDMHPNWYITNENAGKSITASGNWGFKTSNGQEEKIEFDYAQNLATEAYHEATNKVDGDDVFLILFTSGSTGKSKAAMLTHKNCMVVPNESVFFYKQNKEDVGLVFLPLSHIFGFSILTSATFCGHSVMFPNTKKIDNVLSCIEKYKVSVIYSVPTFFLEMLVNDNYKNYDVSSLRVGVVAGGPITTEQMLRVEKALNFKFVPAYGLTEESFISTISVDASTEDCCAGIGVSCLMTKICILDGNATPVKQGEVGEICAKGVTQMIGYYKNEEETRKIIDANGWTHTGDLGYFDEKGILHIAGRKKDIILRGGENISAVKVEGAFYKIEGIYQVAVVAKADEKYGEVPVAAVVLEKDCTLTEQEIKEKLLELLSKHEIPPMIKIVDSFPKNTTGKIDKLKIKEMF